MAENPTEAVQSAVDYGTPPEANVDRWLAEIKTYESLSESWRKDGETIIKRYRDEHDTQRETDEAARRFNVLWSNVETLKPAVLSKPGVPVVARRHGDRAPLARAASTITERLVAAQIDDAIYDFHNVIESARDDYLLVGRGVAWARYEPIFTKGTERKDVTPKDGGYVDENGEPVDPEAVLIDDDQQAYIEEPVDPDVLDERVVFDYVDWKDFGHTPAPKWTLVRAVWRRVEMTRKQCHDKFGAEIASKISYTVMPQSMDEEQASRFRDVFKRAEVYEIWDKDTRKVIWVSPGYKDGALKVVDDFLGLRAFFPCPRPMYATLTNDTLVPVPDYHEYRSQAIELDILTERISVLTDAIRVAGIYDGQIDATQDGAMGKLQEQLFSGNENILIPVPNWQAIMEGGGVAGKMQFLPIKEIAETLAQLVSMRREIKQDLFEITGLSDLLRGQGVASETATAQRIKGQYATMRLDNRKSEVARFVRDCMRIMAEMSVEHFDPQTIMDMSGWADSAEAEAADEANAKAVEAAKQAAMQAQAIAAQGGMPQPIQAPPPPPGAKELFQQAVILLKNDRMRTFKLDIETDSTIEPDYQAEKEARIELLGAMTPFLKEAIPLAQQHPKAMSTIKTLLRFTLQGFKVGQSLEAEIENNLDDLADIEDMPKPGEQEEKRAQAELALQKEKIDREDQRAAADRDHKSEENALDRTQERDLTERRETHEFKKTKMDRANAIDDRDVGRKHALEDRRLEGKVTPTMEEDMKEAVAMFGQMMQAQQQQMAQMLATMQQANQQQMQSLAEAVAGIAASQDANQQMMLRALTAPKKLKRDAQGRPEGVETVMQ